MWTKIKGFENEYEINENGDVKSLKRNIIIKPYNTQAGRGYLAVDLYKGKCRCRKVHIHRLIAETFILNPLNKKEVNHINGNTFDNRIENLEWVTKQENMRHAVDVLGVKLLNANDKTRKKISHPIIKYDTDGKELARYESIAEASRKEKTCASFLREHLLGKYKLAKGFIYKYDLDKKGE